MASKTIDVFCALKRDEKTADSSSSSSSAFQVVSPPLSATYKPQTDTLRDLIPLALSRWCDLLRLEDAPIFVTSLNKMVLAKHWRVIVVKTSRKGPPQPADDTDPSLNVDRFLAAAFKRSQSSADLLMPEIWIVPVSGEAREFALSMDERRELLLEADDDRSPDQSPRTAPPSPKAALLSDSRAGAAADEAYLRDGAADGDDDGGDFRDGGAPSGKLTSSFDRAYLQQVERRKALFKYVTSSPSSTTAGGSNSRSSSGGPSADGQHRSQANDEGYVHWSDLMQHKPGGRSLRTFHGDKSALSESLQAAWEAAAEAEERAQAAWKKMCAEKMKNGAAAVTQSQTEAAELASREKELRRNLTSITAKRAEFDTKTGLLEGLQKEVHDLEMKLDVERQRARGEDGGGGNNNNNNNSDIVRAQEIGSSGGAGGDDDDRMIYGGGGGSRGFDISNYYDDGYRRQETPSSSRATRSVTPPPPSLQQQRRSVGGSGGGGYNNTEENITNNNNYYSTSSASDSLAREYLDYLPSSSATIRNPTTTTTTAAAIGITSSSGGRSPAAATAGSLLRHMNGLSSTTALEAALSLLSPGTASEVQAALQRDQSSLSASSVFSSSTSGPLSYRHRMAVVAANASQQQQQQQQSTHHDNDRHDDDDGGGGGGGGGGVDDDNYNYNNHSSNSFGAAPYVGPSYHHAVLDQSHNASASWYDSTFGPGGASPQRSAMLRPGVLAAAADSVMMNNQEQHSGYHNNNNNNNNHAEVSSYPVGGGGGGGSESPSPARGGGGGGGSSSTSSDLRVPLRLLASDLDAYLTRSLQHSATATSGDVPPSRHTFSSSSEQQQQHQMATMMMPPSSSSSTSAALLDGMQPRTSDPNYFGEDLETRGRILDRVQHLKSVLSQPRGQQN